MGRLNFPAHAYVALAVAGDDPGFLFGAVLPDLTNMAGARFDRELPPAVEAGRLLHHRADECFHDDPAFRAGVSGIRASLRGHGLLSGPSRAGAHLAYELLLDTFLPWDDGVSAALDAAFGHGARLAAELAPGPRDRWSALLGRLQGIRWSGMSTTSDADVAHRIEVVLARRPRLALPAGSRGSVEASVAAARPGVGADSESVLAAVASSLRS